MQKINMKIWMVVVIIILFCGASFIPTLTGSNNLWKEKNQENQVVTNSYHVETTRGTITETLYPTDDAHVDECQPTNNEGDSPWFKVRRGGTGFEVDGLIKFDTSSIPVSVTINSATAHIYYNSYDSNPAGRPINFHRLVDDWDEGTVTWSNRPSHDATVSSTAIIPASAGQWMEWDVTSSVQEFVNGENTNYGWKLIDPTTAGSTSLIVFRSKDYADSDYHPYLEIDYETVEDDPIAANWLGNQQITNTIGVSEYPDIKSDSSGNLHIFWHDNRDGTYEIYYKKLANNGSELVADKRITDVDGALSQYPSVGVDSEDNLHVVWQDLAEGHWEVYYKKLDDNGVSLIETEISDNPSDSMYPVVAVSPLDTVHVAWQDDRDGNKEIYYKKLDNNGVILTEEVWITEDLAGSEVPSIAAYSEYIATIAWHDNRQGEYDILYDDAFVDLMTSSISYSSSDPDPKKQYLAQVGVQLNVTVKITNVGDIPVDNVLVQVLCDTSQIWSENVTMPIGSSTNTTFSWTPPQQGFHRLTACIDPLKTSDDAFRLNNDLTITIPIVDPAYVWDTKIVSFPEIYDDIILAFNHLTIEPMAELILNNCGVVFYGTNSYIINQGMLHIHNSYISSSHNTEYISQFTNTPSAQFLELTGCDIHRLGGTGITLQSASFPIIIDGNTIQDSQTTAITLHNGMYTYGMIILENNIIINSGTYDYNMYNAEVEIYNSYFDWEKVNVDDSSSLFDYYRHIQCTVWDDNDTLVEGAEVEIKNGANVTVYTGTTNENGEIEPQLLHIFQKDGTRGRMGFFFGPHQVHAYDPNSGRFGGSPMPDNGMAMPLPAGNWELKLSWATRTKYAILVAGLDSSSQDHDRYAFWNEIEFMYKVLTNHKGYKPENVKVLFMNGKDGTSSSGNPNAIIDCKANLTNLNLTIQWVGARIHNDFLSSDTLLFFSSDHGADGGKLCMHEGSHVTKGKLAQLIDTYIGDNAYRIFFVMGQCYSGRFLQALHGPQRVVITAAYPTTYSWWYRFDDDSNPRDGHSYYTVEFISSLYNKQPNTGCYPDAALNLANYLTDYYQKYPEKYPYHNSTTGLVNLDDDGNGKISVHESFDYALDNDLMGPVDGRAHDPGEGFDWPQEVDDDFVVMGCSSGKLLLYRYDGDGTLSGDTFNIGGNLVQVAVKYIDSVNGDDIVALDNTNNQVKVLLNRGDYTFTVTNYSVGANPLGLWVGDVTGDGYADIVTANKGDNDVTVLKNNCFGGFGNRKDYSVGAGGGPHKVMAANLDGINHNDLVILNENGKTFTVMLNSGSGTFPTKTTYSLGGIPAGLDIGRINNVDPWNDLVIALSDNDEIEVWTNNGNGVFSWYSNATTKSSPAFPILIDLNFDSGALKEKDLVLAHKGSSAFYAYNNSGTGTFLWRGIQHNLGAWKTCLGLFTTDLDGDEDDAIALGNPDQITVFRNCDRNKDGIVKFASINEALPSGTNPVCIAGTNHNHARYYYIGG